jgi:hypothetical protein
VAKEPPKPLPEVVAAEIRAASLLDRPLDQALFVERDWLHADRVRGPSDKIDRLHAERTMRLTDPNFTGSRHASGPFGPNGAETFCVHLCDDQTAHR